MSVRETLATTLQGVKASQQYLNNLYDRGLTAKAILRYTGDLNEGLRKKLLDKIEDFINSKLIQLEFYHYLLEWMLFLWTLN